VFLGDDLLAWLTLAIGGAMAFGNILAIVKPPDQRRGEGDLEAAPVGRSLLFAAVGLAASIWAIATLFTAGDESDEALQLDATSLHSTDDLGEASES
jgi:hypothetical protein